MPLVDCLLTYRGRNRSEFGLIASGGVKNGLDSAKCLALGADFTATAQPIIKAIVENGEDGMEALLQKWHKELKTTMLLCGYQTVNQFGFDTLM
jgi:isopentenyl-diphosphate delta-isomerase